MNWFAAHIVMWVRIKGKRQTRFPCWENIVLIQAESETEAFRKAEKRGHQEEGDCDGSFRWGGQPATWVFGGVRKLVLCEDSEERPGDGSEITYTEVELESKEALEKLIAGDPTTLQYVDRFPTRNGNHKTKKPKARSATVRMPR
jgi:hypothetical protein